MDRKLRLSVSDFGWSELIENYLKHVQATKKPTTHRSYRLQLSLFERWILSQDPAVELWEFRASTLDAYLIFRQANGVSDLTRSYDAKLVKMLLEYAFKEDHIDRRPLRDYRVRHVEAREQRSPTVGELEKFLSFVEKRWNPATNPPIRFVTAKERKFYRLRDMAIFTGLMETATRINEMLSLTISDLDTAKMEFVLQDTKSNRPRTVPFTSRWLECVKRWREVRPRCDSEALFVSAYGEDLTPNQLSKSFRIYRDLAGLPKDLHLHSLRHYALTTIAEVSQLAAQGIAGHKDPATTAGYTHARQEFNRRMHEQADPLGKILYNAKSEKQRSRRKLI